MISIRKQIFILFTCIGACTLILTAFFVNMTIGLQFSDYVETNINKASQSIVTTLEQKYDNEGQWSEQIIDELSSKVAESNFSFALLDNHKNKIWGATEEELMARIDNVDYPLFYGASLSKMGKCIYIFKDIPVQTKKYGLVAYARIGYYPAFMLSRQDIIFRTNINRSIIWSGLFGLGCFIFIGAYITRIFTQPICAIAKTSMELSQGKYKSRYTKHSSIKELENLRYSMNYLAGKLEQQDTLRRKLVSDLSHEIRTPLHILQSNLEAMIDGIYPIDEDQMQVLYQEVVRFSSLLNNLDKLKNTELDHAELKLEEVFVNTAIKEIYTAFKIIAVERQLHYKLQIKETEQITILADKDAFKQILMNVISNAFKFTEKGSIIVSTQLKGKQIEIEIKDAGIGIAKEDLPYVFERMYRGDKSREKYEGSGIGLTLVKCLVTLHGGQIEINSEENIRTQVLISLPVCSNKRSKLTYTDLDIKD